MKQELRFMNSHQFQNFTAQLFSEEMPSFQPIEGAGGDGGLDGIDKETAYQMFFPEVKNRSSSYYIRKIDKDLEKLMLTIAQQNLIVKRWIFVVPDDLSKDVVLHLRLKSGELGIECLYWGSTKLTSLVTKYPHIRDVFPEVFLPDVKQDLGEVKSGVALLGRRSNSHGVEIMTDDEYMRQRTKIKDAQGAKYQAAHVRFTGSSAEFAATEAYAKEVKKEMDDLIAKKENSDRFFALEVKDIEDVFDNEYRDKQLDLSRRNMLSSGFGSKELTDIEDRKRREIKKLELKYGTVNRHNK